MNKRERYNFRMSYKWKKFRIHMKKKAGYIDYITKHPLTRSWNLHHCDLRTANYDHISDDSRFVALNKNTHDFVHWLYSIWIKDKDVINRIVKLMEHMEKCSHDKRGRADDTERVEDV